MLHDTRQIAEPDIDKLHAFVSDVPKEFLGIGEQHVLLVIHRWVSSGAG
jgi:hypothetical protein